MLYFKANSLICILYIIIKTCQEGKQLTELYIDIYETLCLYRKYTL